ELPLVTRMLSTSARRIFVLLAVTCVASLVSFRATHGAEQEARANEETLRKAYADKVRESYNFPFGKGTISVPGNAGAVGDDFLEPSAFLDAQYCGHCHKEAYHQWRQALHS